MGAKRRWIEPALKAKAALAAVRGVGHIGFLEMRQTEISVPFLPGCTVRRQEMSQRPPSP
jgi:hypothetical protein